MIRVRTLVSYYGGTFRVSSISRGVYRIEASSPTTFRHSCLARIGIDVCYSERIIDAKELLKTLLKTFAGIVSLYLLLIGDHPSLWSLTW